MRYVSGSLAGVELFVAGGRSFPKSIFLPNSTRKARVHRVVPRVLYIANTRIELHPFICNRYSASGF